jgi:3-methyladenine DNA glycosylase AlkD
MDPVIARIRKDLSSPADPATQKTFQRFFKETVKCYGVNVPTVTKIARKYWKEIKFRDKQEIFGLCEELFKSGYCEEAFIVSNWIPNLKDRYEQADLAVFRHWIDTYISNWATCDGFCNHSMGTFIEKYPAAVDELRRWTKSENRWMRRAAAVSLIVPAKRGKFLYEAMGIADLLLTDNDDMVQKGYGWLLKEVSRQHQPDVFAYVMKKRMVMPRTALRYAIELMPAELRSDALKKERPSKKK